MKRVHLYRDGRWIAGPLDQAETFREKNRGLLGRDALDPGTGMVIERCGMIHTWFMRFPIDVMFLSRRGRVVKVRHEVKPFRIACAPFAHRTVEMPAGLAHELGLERGQSVELRNEGPGAGGVGDDLDGGREA